MQHTKMKNSASALTYLRISLISISYFIRIESIRKFFEKHFI